MNDFAIPEKLIQVLKKLLQGLSINCKIHQGKISAGKGFSHFMPAYPPLSFNPFFVKCVP
jgi:hypothetical protein